MTAFLLLVGLALFVSGGAMYLAHAARHEPRWVAGSIFFPFVVPLYYQRNWEELYPAGLLQGSGFVMALAGTLMLLFQSVQPEGLANVPAGEAFSSDTAHQDSGFVDSARALKLLAGHQAGTPVGGRVHGRDFHPDRVELIDDTLRLTEGPTFLPIREIAIHFPAGSLESSPDKIKQTIAPDMRDVPVVEVTWPGDDGLPVSEKFRGGYRLQLDLASLVRNKLSGYIQMMLPDRQESYVAGDITAITSHLRYNGDVVDRQFDHEDTLKYIAEEYLRSIYPEADIDTISFSNLVLDPLAGNGETMATVKLKDGRTGNHIIKVAKNEFGWNVLVQESAAATEAAGYKPVYSVMSQVVAGQATAAAPRAAKAAAPARKPVERTLAFEQLGSLAGQGAVVEYRNGRQEQGVLRGMQKNRLVLDAMKEGGVVQYLIAEDELARLRMNSGDVINLAGYSPAAQTTAQMPAPAGATSVAPAHVEFAGTDITPYMNRVVKVVTKGGKSTVGILRGVRKDGLVLETQVGAGKVDYTVMPDDFGSISYASQ